MIIWFALQVMLLSTNGKSDPFFLRKIPPWRPYINGVLSFEPMIERIQDEMHHMKKVRKYSEIAYTPTEDYQPFVEGKPKIPIIPGENNKKPEDKNLA